MGSSVFRTGALGSGHAMKALNNYVSAAGLAAAAEALRIGQGFGLDPVLMTDILNASTGRNNATEVKLKQFVISRSFNSGFPLRLMAKDVRTARRHRTLRLALLPPSSHRARSSGTPPRRNWTLARITPKSSSISEAGA